MSSKKKKRTKIERIHEKLFALLNADDYTSSEVVIDEFKQYYPDDWKKLVGLYGDSSDAPGTGARRHYYSSSCYLADRLCDLKRTGKIHLMHTVNFDHLRWPCLQKMGSWMSIPTQTMPF
ncbi:MAG: hypothetical protein HQK50_17255 [Oligoflexia bacterium]|nr:hypothetical protein [Oligoflexia bacterium]